MNLRQGTQATVLDRQLREARIRAFIGRDEELATFRNALNDGDSAFAILHLYGPGGIGKSTLLRRFADEARQMGRAVVFLQPGPDNGRPVHEGHTTECTESPVVLIDALDRLTQPEHWLREAVLPAFASGTLFVVASRQPPSVEWRSELGWTDLLRPLAVEPFSPEQSTAMLRAHDVPEARQESALSAGGGNPLALRVAAQFIGTDPQCVTDEDLHRCLAVSIFDQLIGDVPSWAHRQALQVCAHAATTNENLLRAAVPGADPAELFAWLRDLPFVAWDARGLYPSEVVRNVVEAELRWRDADEFAAMHERVKHHLIKRARATVSDAVLPFIADVIFVMRSESRPLPILPRLDGLEVREHQYQPADLLQVREIALRTEGADSARLVEFWLQRQPEAFRVYRRRDQREIIAFFGQLSISHPSDEELGADPLVAAAWSRTQSITPLRSGEHVNIVRYLVDAASYQRPSESMALMQLRVAEAIICDDQLAWQVVASPDAGYWGATIERVHPRDDGPPVVVGGRPYTLYSQYFRSMDIAAWSDQYDDRMLDRRPRSAAGPRHRAVAWTRAEFDQEVRHTLRSWHRPDVLAESRMARGRMVAEAGSDDAVAGLRRTFTAALETLRNDPRQAKYHRVLVATFLNGAPTQEAAAQRLDLPFSTYRRHLGRGLDGLSALLWKAETHGIGLLSGGSPAAP